MANRNEYDVDKLFGQDETQLPSPVQHVELRQNLPFKNSPFSKGATSTIVDEFGGVHTQSWGTMNEFGCNHIFDKFEYAGRCSICGRIACWKCLAECALCGRLLCNRHKMKFKEQFYCFEHWEEKNDMNFIIGSFKLIGKILLFPFQMMIRIFSEPKAKKTKGLDKKGISK